MRAYTLRRWQGEALPLALAALEERRAGVVQATTGAGKSIFLAELLRRWRERHAPAEGVVVVTTPTRKLVEQLAGTFRDVLGGPVVGMYYTKAKQDRREVVVCCNASVPALAARLQVEGRKVALWVADECHRTETDSVKGEVTEGEIAGLLQAERRMGLTATPFRSDDDDALTLYTETLYTYSPADALRDGVIVPARYVLPEDDNAEVDDWTARKILELGDRATRGPGAVDASSIADAEGYVETLARYGLEARAIHSRMTDEAQREVLRALQAGEVDCVVHVAMLVEGVDMPWLRWLAVRRETGSRIRWIQQVGRVIRAAAGKVEAVILDPHAQSMDYSPTYAAALGWPDREAEERERRELVERERREVTDPDATPEELYVARVGSICRYLRALRNALASEAVGMGPRERGTRADDPTPKQVAALRRMRGLLGRMVEEHRAPCARMVETPGVLTLGSAGDLLDILHGLRHVALGEWRPAAPVPLPPEEAFAPVQRLTLPVYCDVAMRGPRLAGVAIRGGVQVVGKVRPKVKGDTAQSALGRLVEGVADRFGRQDIRVSDAIIARNYAATYPGMRYVDGKDNPAKSRAWAMIVQAEKAGEAPVPEVARMASPPLEEVPPPTDADAPGRLFGARWAARG